MKPKIGLVAISMAGLIFFCLPGGNAAEKPGFPPDNTGYIWIPNVEKTLEGLSGFTQKLNIPNISSILFRIYLGELLENSSLSGVNLDAPLGLVFFKPEGTEENWAVVFSLYNPDAYLRELAKTLTLKTEDKKSGTTIYTKEVKTFDAKAYQKASSDKKQDYNKFFKTEVKQICLAVKDNYAWLSRNPARLNSLKDVAISDLVPPVKSNLVLVLEMKKLLPYIQKEVDKSFSKIQAAAAISPSAFGQEFTKQFFQSYLQFYFHFTQQVERLTIGLTIDETGIAFEKLLEAEPDSGLDEFLHAQKTGPLTLARYLDPEAWMVIDARIEQRGMLITLYEKLFKIFEVLAEGPLPSETPIDVNKIKETYFKNITAYFNCIGDEIAISFSSSPESLFSSTLIQKIKDEPAYRSYLRQTLPETISIWKPLYENSGIKYDLSGIEKPSQYKNSDIYTFQAQLDPNRILQDKKMDGDAKQFIHSLLDKPITTQMAVLNGLGVYLTSWGGEPDIRPLLDNLSVKKDTYDLKQLGPCAENATAVIYLSLNNYLGLMSRLLTPLEPPSKTVNEMFGKLNKMTDLDLPLLICLRAEGATLGISTRIPIAHIQSVKQLLEAKTPGGEKISPVSPRASPRGGF